MDDGRRSAPLLLTFVAVVGFFLLFLLGPQQGTEARQGDPLAILHIPEMRAGDICRQEFAVHERYDSISLNYRFQLAIKPRIEFEDPQGDRHVARLIGQNLTLDISDPTPGTWALNVTVASSPGLATGIREGRVFVLGFPETPEGGSRPSICQRDVPDS